jgi:hypothetical protein
MNGQDFYSFYFFCPKHLNQKSSTKSDPAAFRAGDKLEDSKSRKTLRAYVQKAKMLHKTSAFIKFGRKKYLLMMLLGAKPRNPSQGILFIEERNCKCTE